MIKKKSKVITILVLLIILICSIYHAPIRVAAEEKPQKIVPTRGEWEEVEFVEQTNQGIEVGEKQIDSICFNAKLHVTYISSIYNPDNEELTNIIYVQAFNGTKWENIGQPIISNAKTSLVEQIKFCIRNEELYIFYASEGLLEVSKLNTNNNTWIEITSIKDVSGTFEIASEDDKTYITATNQNQSTAKIYEFDGTNLIEISKYFENNGYIGEPKVVLLKGTLYVSVKEAGRETITLYKYINGTTTKVEDCNVKAFTYTMAIVSENIKDKIYISAVTSNEEDMIIYTYDEENWDTIETGLKFEIHTPHMVVKEGDIYILALVVDGKLQTYTYSKETGEFSQEGNDVDTAASTAQAIAYNDYIYTIYVTETDNQVNVKRKEYIRDYFRGDINQDDTVNVRDAIFGARALAKEITLTEKQKSIGDVTDDGTFNVRDLIKLAKFLAKEIHEL